MFIINITTIKSPYGQGYKSLFLIDITNMKYRSIETAFGFTATLLQPYFNLTATAVNQVQTVHQNVAFSSIFSHIILYIPPGTHSKNTNGELRIRRLWVQNPLGRQ
jgi:hypothetical protein